MQKQLIKAITAKKNKDPQYNAILDADIAEASSLNDLPWIYGKYINQNTMPLQEQQWLLDSKAFVPQLTTQDPKNVFVSYNGNPVLMQTYDPEIVMLPIEEGLQVFGKKIRNMQEQSADTAPKDKISLLTKVQYHNGVFIYVPDSAALKTMRIYIYNSIGEGDIVDSMRNIILIGKNNQVEIIAEDLPIAGEGISLASLYEDVYLDDNSSCSYIHLATHAQNVYAHTHKALHVFNDTDMQYIDILLGSLATTQSIHMNLAGNGSKCHVYGIAVPDNSQLFENYVTVNNKALHTEGKVLYKNVVDDNAIMHFEGMIKVFPGADNTNSYLEDHTILLSSQAKTESVPGLEIEANEVKASHGATVGSIDQEVLFYVMSRGLNENMATQLIVTGFLSTIVENVFDDAMKDRILTYIGAKLHD